jgi:phage terminase small subunit
MARAATDHPALAGLTEKRRRFVLAYVGEAMGNATEAARIAGYAKPTEEGSFLLRNPQVRDALRSVAAPAENAKIASTEEIHERLTAILRGEVKTATRTESETGASVSEKEPTPAEMAAAAKLLLTARGELVKRVERVDSPGSRDELITKLESTLAKLKGGA